MGNCLKNKQKQDNKRANKYKQAESVLEPARKEINKNKVPPIKRKKLRREDFMFQNMNGRLMYKPPGSIIRNDSGAGNCFSLRNLENCWVYLHDMTGQIFVDELKNCMVHIGPCSSSIFVRTCTDCKFVLSCQQLRMRDDTNCTIMLHSNTEPVVESSTNITFLSHQSIFYPEMLTHIREAKLSLWVNKWNDVYDFSQAKSD